MRSFVSPLALAATAFAALASASPARAEGELTMVLASVAPPDSPWSVLLSKYKSDVEAQSKGRIKVKLKLGGTLGDENETVTKCHRGMIQAVGASTGALASLVPELHVVELPYLFKNAAEADHVIDKALTPELEKLFKKRGVVLGFWSENGFRHFGTRSRPIKVPDDLKGLKMRAQESPVHMSMYKAFGASATPIPTTEVPQALATGNVDGFDQSALYALATSWTKSIKYFTVSEHIYQPAAIVFNQEWFNGLSPDLQAVVINAGRNIQDSGRKAVRDIFEELLEIMKSEKIEIVRHTAAERAVFEKAAQAAYVDFRKEQNDDADRLLDLANASLKAFRKGK